MRETIVIEPQFCGPPDSGNGGYVCGLLAGYVAGDAEVTLRMPPPLGVPLVVERTEPDRARLLHGEALVAEARRADVEPLALIPAPTLSAAFYGSHHYVGFSGHAFPNCYVCGPERDDNTGLGICPGRFRGDDVVACPWTPTAETVGASGDVGFEFIAAALDCPGGIAVMGERFKPFLLGRLAVRQIAPVAPRETYVVAGWPIARDGRKHLAGTAIYDAAGKAKAYARATWVAPAD